MLRLTTATRQVAFRQLVVLGGLLLIASRAIADEVPRGGAEIYRAACSTCHGPQGQGAPPGLVGFSAPLPDFTDCDFAAREPDSDWVGVACEGGPSRGFSELMPAFQGALTVEQLQLAVDHIRSFCQDVRWPRGELNLPRALVTGKAYPEDEAVITAAIDTDSPGAVLSKVVYEQRFGPRSQWEIVVPFGWRETEDVIADDGSTRWSSSLGDVALALKHALHHDGRKGTIVSAAGEIILPTGDDELGFGKGTTVFEPFVAWGQILPADFFLQSQLGLELPADTDRADREGFLRLALGWTATRGEFGRAWSPMVELLTARELAGGASASYDLVPQIQITLNKRQHVMANVGVRTPLNDRSTRSTQVLLYLLWDWFDGALTEGW